MLQCPHGGNDACQTSLRLSKKVVPLITVYFSPFSLDITSSIYHKDQQVYTEKEITALAAKAGVNANSIEAVHNGLIDDGLVEKQKIGGSNFFWSFKAKKDRKAQIQHETTLKLVEELKPKVRETEAALADAKRGREDDPEEEGATENGEEENNPENGGGGGRAKKLARLSELAKEKAALEAELAVLKENDPDALADL
jgi:DNA-binding transcriptional regulator YhcF (GntR family)